MCKSHYLHPWMRVARRVEVEICACFIWSIHQWIRTRRSCSCLLSHVLSCLVYLSVPSRLRSRFFSFRLMSDDILIVPTVLPSGALHFASVRHDGTVSDVISSLSALDEVKADILGDLPPCGWAIQLIRKESPGRQWEEDVLESLGDGTYLWNLPENTRLHRSTFRRSRRDSQGRPLDPNRSIRSFASASFLSFRPDISSSFACLAPRLFAPLTVRLGIVSSCPGDSRRLHLEVLFFEDYYR